MTLDSSWITLLILTSRYMGMALILFTITHIIVANYGIKLLEVLFQVNDDEE